MVKLILSLLGGALCSLNCFAATVDTVNIYSNSMHKDIRCVVIRPIISQRESTALPVVYLLHGYGGSYSNWITRVPELKNYADEYKLMIVCPDGHQSGWYIDSPFDSSMQYESHIAKEVPAYIDAHYSTIKNRNARAITGLSMGGHGGLLLGFLHADTFGACGSMSGVADLNTIRNKYELIKRIGDTVQYADNWKKYSVIDAIENYPQDSIAIIFDCGNDDFFYATNHALHEKMLRLKIPHDYIERPGNHNWSYWANAVRYQLLFFRIYFDKNKN